MRHWALDMGHATDDMRHVALDMGHVIGGIASASHTTLAFGNIGHVTCEDVTWAIVHGACGV